VSEDPAAPHARRRVLSPKSEKEPARPHSAEALGGGDDREHRRRSRAAQLQTEWGVHRERAAGPLQGALTLKQHV
jgi:hypothetical protein